jgi:NTE family protein
MSCGLPFFFEPVKMSLGFGESLIVDGGVLSNFPIWLFDDPLGKSQRPVIGLKISSDHKESSGHIINNSLNLFEALFSTMQSAHDEKYISRQHEKNIIFIPVGDTKTTDFELDSDTKLALMENGRTSTIKFLKSWSPRKIEHGFQKMVK